MGDLDHATRDIYKYFVNGPFGCRKAMQLALGGFDHRQQKLKSGAQGGGHAPDIFHFFFFFSNFKNSRKASQWHYLYLEFMN